MVKIYQKKYVKIVNCGTIFRLFVKMALLTFLRSQ